MTDVLNVGIDFGSTGLRVAYVAEGAAPTPLDDPMAPLSSWLLCDPLPASRLGVVFSSVKSELGNVRTGIVNHQARTPAAIVADAFRGVREAVAQRTSRTVGRAVITVPARYSSSQRTVLREAAVDAGFLDAHLINDSVAAVIGHHAADEAPSTVLVCSIGYSGFELGLVRVARGHYRALAYETGTTPSGSSLDLRLLEAVFALVAEHGLAVDTRGWDAALWLQVRSEAQRIKEELSAREQVDFPAIRTADGQRVARVRFRRRDFETVVDQMFSRTLDRTKNLFEQANVVPEDIDTLLLVGGTTRIPSLQSLTQARLARQPVLLRSEGLAAGAALHAARLDARRVVATAEVERASDAFAGETASVPPTVRADIEVSGAKPGRGDDDQFVLLARPVEERSTASSKEPADTVGHARRLLEEGRPDEARAMLEALVAEARALLATIPASPASASRPSDMSVRARRALTRAEQLLASGHFEEAVQTSHAAWRESSDNPDTFERMIDVHCRAAASATDPSRYADAQRWLLCAYSHDGSNVRIRNLLAERHYLQAKHLFDHGKRKDAAQTLERCFSIDPDHIQARGLHQLLARR